jgi:membrane protease subunit HflC
MSNAQRTLLVVLIAVLLLIVLLGRSMMFTVNERELAVVLRFEKPIVEYTEPGLRFKWPLIDRVRRLPKTHQFWIGLGSETLTDVNTADLKKLEVTPWAIWRITEPTQFVINLREVHSAEGQVKDIVRSGIRQAIKSYDLDEVVRSRDRELTYAIQVETLGPSEPREAAGAGQPGPAAEGAAPETLGPREPGADEPIKVGREEIIQQIQAAAERRLRGELLEKGDRAEEAGQPEAGLQAVRGIELVDVGIAKIDFVDEVRDAAFQRLIAFMESIAQKNEAAGEKAKTQILNEANAMVQQIEGEGKGEANTIRGEADAQVIQMYADTIKKTGEFYNFVRTLEAYKEAMTGKTRLILTTDSEMFKLLTTVPPLAPPPPDEEPPEETSAESGPAEVTQSEKAPEDESSR